MIAGEKVSDGLDFRVTGFKAWAKSKTITLETQRKRREQRFFWVVTLAKPFRRPERLLPSSRPYPKKPLLPPLPLRFKVYGFDFVLVAARSRGVSRFGYPRCPDRL